MRVELNFGLLPAETAGNRYLLSGEYREAVSGATVGHLETPGAPVKSDSYWYLVSCVLSAVVSLAELLWIKQSIISIRAEIWANKGPRFAIIILSNKFRQIHTLFFSLPSVASASISLFTSSSCADISSCAFDSYEFLLLNVLNL